MTATTVDTTINGERFLTSNTANLQNHHGETIFSTGNIEVIRDFISDMVWYSDLNGLSFGSDETPLYSGDRLHVSWSPE